jgi:thiamine biosynthesis lipoprotein
MKTPYSIFAGALLFWMVFSASCTPASRGPETQYVLGTFCTINLFDKGNSGLYTLAFNKIHYLEDIFSANLEGTDLDRVNKSAGLEPVKVRPELIDVLEKALEYAEKSGGAFDPTVGPLVKLWGIGSGEEQIPEAEEIQKALELIDYREVEINREEGTVFLKRAGMALDLGAIAKGYAADEVSRLLADEGVESAIIDLGGNIFALGERRESNGKGAYWRIGVQDPRADRGNYIGILNVKNKSVVTSGMYERFFEKDGKRYHHIFSINNGLTDGSTAGFPVENGLLSVTIAAGYSIDADALSTAAFALGWEKGRELIAGIEGAEGIFVFDDLSVRVTGNLEENFTLTAAEYQLTLSPPVPAQKSENY